MDADEHARVYLAMQSVLAEFTAAIRAEVGDGFPEKVSAFRPARRYMGVIKKRVRAAQNRCSALSTLTTKQTTVQYAKRAASSTLIARCRDC
jgi:hypothetical protein